MKLIKEHVFFILCLLLCTLLRFIPLFEYQFTFDELSGLDRTQFNSVQEVLEKGVKIDAHPALVQLIIYFLSSTFGFVTWIIKLPFLLFGHAAIIYAYFFALRNFSKQVANIAVAFFAFSFIFIFYAPIARMYISGVFFSVAVLYHFFEVFFRKNNKKVHYFLLGVFALLSALNHHISALFAFSVCASGLFFLNRQNFRPFLWTCVFTVLFYLPHLGITLYQLSVPGIGRDAGGWLETPRISVFFEFVRTILGTGKTYMILLALIAAALISKKPGHDLKKQAFLFFIFIFNFLIIYFYSVLRSPIFQYSVMLFSGSAFVLFIASLIRFKDPLPGNLAFVIVCAVLLYQSYYRKSYLTQSVKTVYEYQFGRTAYYKDRYGDAEVFPLFFDCDTLMRKIYFKKYQTSFPLKMSRDKEISDGLKIYFNRAGTEGLQQGPDEMISSIRLFSEFVAGLKSNYVALSSSTPVYQAILAEYFPFLVENTQTQGINYKVYAKKRPAGKTADDDAVVYRQSAALPGEFVYSPSLPVTAGAMNEFPFGAKAPYLKVVRKEGETVLVKSRLKMSGAADNRLELVLSTVSGKDNSSLDYTSKAAGDFLLQPDSTVTVYSDLYIGTRYKEISRDHLLNCYFWNRGRQAFKILSCEILVIDYWPGKWQTFD